MVVKRWQLRPAGDGRVGHGLHGGTATDLSSADRGDDILAAPSTSPGAWTRMSQDAPGCSRRGPRHPGRRASDSASRHRV